MGKSLPIPEQISEPFDREEAGEQPPHGKVLDLGCGSGIWAIQLATSGSPLNLRITAIGFDIRSSRLDGMFASSLNDQGPDLGSV